MKTPILTPEQITQLLGDSPTGLKAQEKNPLAIAAARQQSPYFLINLWDMVQFIGHQIFTAVQELDRLKECAANAIQQSGLAAEMSEEEAKRLLALNKQIMKLGAALELRSTQSVCSLVFGSVEFGDERRHSIVENYLKDMRDTIEMEFRGKHFAFIPSDKIQFWEQAHFFGPKVTAAASNELNVEIMAAGNCMAMDLNTAAIFHLMRVVECGIRALAPEIGVKMSKRKISQATWSVLIEAMDAQIRESKPPKKRMPAKPLKPGQLKFFRGLLLNINCFKDLWRNDVMHMRGDYDGIEANRVKDHVKAFMSLLESNGVPLK